LKNILNKLVGHKMYNLSSRAIYGVADLENRCNDNVCSKFELVASAKINISTDTGIAHLAAMTNTPTIVIGPPITWNRYNGNNNIHFVSKFEDLMKVYHSLTK
jgi:ADP-heptose:LPS heptosyltransferase